MGSENEVKMVDLHGSENVEITVAAEGSELWINVDGRCLFRSKGHKNLFLATDGTLVLHQQS